MDLEDWFILIIVLVVGAISIFALGIYHIIVFAITVIYKICTTPFVLLYKAYLIKTAKNDKQ